MKSEFFKPLRAWFFERRSAKVYNFIHSILDCAYCFSVWSGFIVSFIMVDLYIYDSSIINLVVCWLLIHRLSNVWHFIIDRFRGSYENLLG